MAAASALLNYATHPGLMLAEWLSDNGMSQSQLAARLDRSVKNINQVVNGVADVSAELAHRLEAVTGVPARLWLNMQVQYDDDRARLRREEALKDYIPWLQKLPVKELRKRGHVQATGHKPLEQVVECLRFFGVASVEAWESVWVAPQAQYRQSAASAADPGAIATWLRLGQIESAQVDVAPFDRQGLLEALPRTKALSREVDGAKIIPGLVEIAARVGVIILFVPDVPGTRLYGATRWERGHPVVQLSLRRKSDDQFWFTLFHELGHVILHGRDDVFIDGDGSARTAAEDEANDFAGGYLIPPDLAQQLRSLRSLSDVERFAALAGVSPGVVVGRLQFEQIRDYTWGAGLKRRVFFSES